MVHIENLISTNTELMEKSNILYKNIIFGKSEKVRRYHCPPMCGNGAQKYLN